MKFENINEVVEYLANKRNWYITFPTASRCTVSRWNMHPSSRHSDIGLNTRVEQS